MSSICVYDKELLLVVSEREKAAMACRLSVSMTRSYY